MVLSTTATRGRRRLTKGARRRLLRRPAPLAPPNGGPWGSGRRFKTSLRCAYKSTYSLGLRGCRSITRCFIVQSTDMVRIFNKRTSITCTHYTWIKVLSIEKSKNTQKRWCGVLLFHCVCINCACCIYTFFYINPHVHLIFSVNKNNFSKVARLSGTVYADFIIG